MVLVAVILILLVVNCISSSCGSSKILTWTGKYKSGVGARAGKYKLKARAGKYKLGARAGKYKLGARACKYKCGVRAGGQGQDREPRKGVGARETQRPQKCKYLENKKSF